MVDAPPLAWKVRMNQCIAKAKPTKNQGMTQNNPLVGCAVGPRNLPSLFRSGLYRYFWMMIEIDFHSVAKIIAKSAPLHTD